MDSKTSSGVKMSFLEAARGIASIIVVCHHFVLAFLPSTKLRFPDGLFWTPAYFLVNGSGAVTFFFVLSGFVLVYRFFHQPHASYLLTSTVKRLPRLMLPAGLTILIGYILLETKLTFHADASTISGSEWLATFGEARFPVTFQPSLIDAIKQCLTVFLFPSSFYYNSNLWTMRPEFLGSLAVFFAAASTLRSGRTGGLIALGTMAISSRFIIPLAYPFLVGTVLAYVLANWPHILKLFKARSWVIGLATAVGMSFEQREILLVTSVLIILFLMATPATSTAISGKFGTLLGEVSFPLYLVHMLVIVSAGSYAFIHTGIAGAAAATAVVSLITLIPFVILERWWVPLLNKISRRIIAHRRERASV